MRPLPPRDVRGFTVLELMIALAILGILLTSVLSITVETYAFLGDTDVDYSVQAEANQALERTTEILRKCGWNTSAGPAVEYPRVTTGGTQVEFRVLRDLDANGYPFDDVTGDLEWGVTVYTIRRDTAGTLRVFNGATSVWHLGRFVESVDFATVKEDATLQQKEIRLIVRTRRLTKRGDPINFTLSGSVDMRN